MVVRHFEIVWSATAEQQLHAIFKYLEEESPEAAEKIVNKILSATRTIVKNPKKYNPINTRKLMMALSELWKFINTGFHTKLIRTLL